MSELPEYLTDQTEEAIRQRMLNSLPSDLDKSEGSFIWDALSPAAIELALAALWAQEVLRRGFASTTFGPYLDLRCEEHGITRKPAIKATGQVKFTGTAGTVVPAGTRVATPADAVTGTPSIEFATKAAVTLDGSGTATAEIEAVEAGAVGNVPAGSVSLMVTPIAGVTGVTNPAATTGGTDEEDDTSLLNRYLQKVRSPSTGGNKADYVNWALEVPGVGGAKVIPLWNGPGTVKVIIVDGEKKPASSALVSAVTEHIEEVRPIGAAVTVVSAIAKTIDISATVVLAQGYTIQAVKDSFEAAVRSYFEEVSLSNTYVSYAKIGTILLSTPGVIDYTGLTLNGSAANVPLADEETPVLGTATLGV